MSATSIAQYVAKYTEFLNKLLSAGPDISEDLNDLQTVRDAIMRIVGRVNKRFGYSAEHGDVLDETKIQQIRQNQDVQALERQVAQKLAASPHKMMGAAPNEANQGAFLDIVMQLFQAFVAHPELLTLILSLFKKPA